MWRDFIFSLYSLWFLYASEYFNTEWKVFFMLLIKLLFENSRASIFSMWRTTNLRDWWFEASNFYLQLYYQLHDGLSKYYQSECSWSFIWSKLIELLSFAFFKFPDYINKFWIPFYRYIEKVNLEDPNLKSTLARHLIFYLSHNPWTIWKIWRSVW